MEITDIKIRKVFQDTPLKAIVSVTLDGCLAVHDIKLIEAGGRIFAVMPRKMRDNGRFFDLVHPTTPAFRSKLENCTVDAYERFISASLQD